MALKKAARFKSPKSQITKSPLEDLQNELDHLRKDLEVKYKDKISEAEKRLRHRESGNDLYGGAETHLREQMKSSSQ
ncbi:Putative LOC100881837 [Caligus rogercresseyi]|uniref:LOC100881837 n=1 Tax=Caligus rogercresseyi TaxID=217165 RepID=A0A7T8KK80_CALRO|nr:Putative LOC100881837 [Caligus rogercresseyi]